VSPGCQEYPDYGFERHKGYGVASHFEALRRFGPTLHHRNSFAPVAAARVLFSEWR